MASKKDTSPYIFQRDKIKIDLSIKELPWTTKQQELIRLALDKKTKIIFIEGPAGTSKTIISVYAALTLLNLKKISDIIMVRTAVESSENKLGFLPGTSDEKIAPYMEPFLDKLEELLPKGQIEALQKDERVLARPVNYLRGLHWAGKAIIADEVQNFTEKELLTLMTRLGEHSKLFLCGDPLQSDLQKNQTDFIKMYKLYNSEEARAGGIHVFEFTKEDIKRSELVKLIIDIYDNRKKNDR